MTGRDSEAGSIGVAVVGAGYWGANLVRNFATHLAGDLRWVCDHAVERARRAVGRYSTVRVTEALDDVLNDPGVAAVAIATPASTHAELTMACLEAGRHVLVEKPLASSVAEGEKLVGMAERYDLRLMCDHTYCYSPAVRTIRELVQGGTLGAVQYFDSVRINLGLVQRDIDVFWDLAPHDLSILDFILPEGQLPRAVAAYGADPIKTGRVCVGYLTLPLDGGGIAHIHVNWLSPTKIRTTIVGGSKRMLVWDDLHPSQRLSMYDKGVELSIPTSLEERVQELIAYRVGDMVAPALPEQEALSLVVGEFFSSIRERRGPLTDGRSGLRVLHILEAASRSFDANGVLTALDAHAMR